jgi:hypothetical protein
MSASYYVAKMYTFNLVKFVCLTTIIWMKICGKCKANKSTTEFHKMGRDNKFQAHCKVCRKGHCNAAYRLKRYGLTDTQYKSLYSTQSGCCAICHIYKDVLAVDHCHITGKVRGLLCRPCNSAIGLFKEKLTSLQSAIAYLSNS